MLELFDNRLAPLTYSLGFLNANAADVADAFRSFLAGTPNIPTKVSRLTGSLEENLLRLQPLVIGGEPPLLATSTRLKGWAAVFEGDAQGQGVKDTVRRMARIMNVPGYFVAAIPPATGPTSGLGGRQFHALGPEDTLGYVRVVDLIENTPGKWIFHMSGEPQPYEDLDAYKRRRKMDRLTDEMLLDYTAAVGLQPWDEDFYRNPSFLITNQEPSARQYTLTQARKKLELE